MTAAICDDDRQWLDYAASRVRDCAKERERDWEVLCFPDVQSLLFYTEKEIDLVFLDIVFEEPSADSDRAAGGSGELRSGESCLEELRPGELRSGESHPKEQRPKELRPEKQQEIWSEPAAGDEPKDGICVAKELNRRWPGTQIVYLTNYLHYAVDVYETMHIWFLVKDRFEEKLPLVLDKAEEIGRREAQRFVFEAEDRSMVNLPVEDLYYLERYDRRTRIVSKQGEYRSRDRLAVLMRLLPQDSFARCHNSILVSLPKVKELHRSTLRMENGEEVQISRAYVNVFHRRFLEWAQRQRL